MQPLVIRPEMSGQPATWLGAVITQEVRIGGERVFTKGQRLSAADAAAVAALAGPVHAVRLSEDEVHEDIAGQRLATAIAGPNLALRGPQQSRYNLVATTKGLLRVDQAGVIETNLLPGIAVFTMQDRLPVLPGKIVTGVKVAPVAVPEPVLREVEARTRQHPLVEVRPFLPLRVGLLTTEPLAGRAAERFEAAVRRKLDWLGGTMTRLEYVPNDPAAVAGMMRSFLDANVDLILSAGGNTIDPLDPTFLALTDMDATIVRFGAPAHPGSMFWLAYRGAVPIFNLASCSMYSKSTVADLVLPWIMTGEVVGNRQLAELGYGGLLDRGMDYRFPNYDALAADPAEEL